MTRKLQDMLIAAIVAFIYVTLVAMLLSCYADAQTYVRPSKGKAITVFSNATADATSASFDWTAFNGVQLYVSFPDNTGCDPNGPELFVEGSSTIGGSYAAVTATNGYLHFRTPDVPTEIFSVAPTPPYLRFRSTRLSANCAMTLVVVPDAFPQAMQVSGPYRSGTTQDVIFPVVVGGTDAVGIITPLRVDAYGRFMSGSTTEGVDPSVTSFAAGAATLVNPSDPNTCSVTCANTDTILAVCGQTNNVTMASGIPLNPASAAGRAGGSYTFTNYGGNVYCRSDAGAATIRCMRTKCP